MTPRPKYNAVLTQLDGVTFHSKAEAARYGELKLLERAGLITNLSLQPKFICHVTRHTGEVASAGAYYADFQYDDLALRSTVIEDVKGVRTPLYKWKKKHVEWEYGITITEVTNGRKR